MKKWLFCFLFFVFTITGEAKTIAISYFDNSSGDAKYNALSKGIADMLITDLSKVKGVNIVEREKLEKLIQEIKLGQSKYFDPKTAQKLGKGLGAENIMTGSFYILDNTLRIDARLIDVESGSILLAEEKRKNAFHEISQEIHDGVGQTLSIIKLNLHLLEKIKNESGGRLNETVELVEKAIVDLRNISNNLYSENLQGFNLENALNDDLNLIHNIGTHSHPKTAFPCRICKSNRSRSCTSA